MLQEAMTVCTQTVCGSFPQRLLALVKLACIASANPNALLQRLKVRDACHRRCESQHPEAHAWVLRLLEPLLLAPIDRLPQRIVGRLFAFSGRISASAGTRLNHDGGRASAYRATDFHAEPTAYV
jgi:hypothetical protein